MSYKLLVLEAMLQRIYGISINDTGLDFDGQLEQRMEQDGTEPWELVAEVADDCSLDRFDDGAYFKTPVTLADQQRITAELFAIQGVGVTPVI